jgi:hypothetical protein
MRAAAILVSLAVPACWAQAVISAHSGMVNFVQGDAQLAGRPVTLDGAIFPEVKPGQTFSTRDGHAEILLTPGVFLRLDRNSSFQMISNHLTDVQVKILSGSAVVDANEILKANRIAVKVGDSETLLLKVGIYHFNADAGQVRTYVGKAQVSDALNSTQLKGGRTLLVGNLLTPEKFDNRKSTDELLAWSKQRDQRLALANMSVARSLGSHNLSNSLWAWDPWMGGYTFLPQSGYGYNPFGIGWYSPASVWIAITPGYGGYSGDYPVQNAPSSGGGGSSSTSSILSSPSRPDRSSATSSAPPGSSSTAFGGASSRAAQPGPSRSR